MDNKKFVILRIYTPSKHPLQVYFRKEDLQYLTILKILAEKNRNTVSWIVRDILKKIFNTSSQELFTVVSQKAKEQEKGTSWIAREALIKYLMENHKDVLTSEELENSLD